MTVTSIQLQSDVEESLNTAAEELHRSKDWLINQAVRDFLKKQAHEKAQGSTAASILDFSKAGKDIDEATVRLWLEEWGGS